MHIHREVQLLTLVAITAGLMNWFPGEANAASASQARITRVTNHVQLLRPMTAGHHHPNRHLLGR